MVLVSPSMLHRNYQSETNIVTTINPAEHGCGIVSPYVFRTCTYYSLYVYT